MALFGFELALFRGGNRVFGSVRGGFGFVPVNFFCSFSGACTSGFSFLRRLRSNQDCFEHQPMFGGTKWDVKRAEQRGIEPPRRQGFFRFVRGEVYGGVELNRRERGGREVDDQ